MQATLSVAERPTISRAAMREGARGGSPSSGHITWGMGRGTTTNRVAGPRSSEARSSRRPRYPSVSPARLERGDTLARHITGVTARALHLAIESFPAFQAHGGITSEGWLCLDPDDQIRGASCA